MLCKAEVNLPDWPEGQMRDVDPQHEQVAGWLRNAWITPLVRRRPPTGSPEPPSPAAKRAKAG